MNINDANLSNGWHSAIYKLPIALNGTESTTVLYFKQHEPGLFRVLGIGTKAWKTTMSFLQLSSLISPSIDFTRIKDQKAIRQIEQDYAEASVLEYSLSTDDKTVLKKLLEDINSEGKIKKERFVSVFEQHYGTREKGKEQAKILLFAGVIYFDEETGEWEILVSEDQILDLPDNNQLPENPCAEIPL